jgi:hypothetical protein
MSKLITLTAMQVLLLAALVPPILAQEGVVSDNPEDPCHIPESTLPFDTAMTGVVERLEEVSPQGDTHAIVLQDGSLRPLRSDIVDLDAYTGQEVTVYIASAPGDESPIWNVVRVGSPQPFGVLFCD